MSQAYGMPDVGFVPSAPQEEAPGFEFLLHCGLLHQWWGLWWGCIPASPTLFAVFFFLFAQCVVIIHPDFRFF